LAAIAAAKGEDPGAIAKVAVVLDGEFVEDEEFAAQVQELAQQIINVQNQSQSQQNNTNYGRDMFVINNPTGEMKLGG
jgi:hypothetical protein